jgi:hypothetical protein
MAASSEILEALADYQVQCNGNARLRRMHAVVHPAARLNKSNVLIRILARISSRADKYFR